MVVKPKIVFGISVLSVRVSDI